MLSPLPSSSSPKGWQQLSWSACTPWGWAAPHPPRLMDGIADGYAATGISAHAILAWTSGGEGEAGIVAGVVGADEATRVYELGPFCCSKCSRKGAATPK